jgi:hypothetical protein
MQGLPNPPYNATCLKGNGNGHNDPKPDNPRHVEAAWDMIKGAQGRFSRADGIPAQLFLYNDLDQATNDDHPKGVKTHLGAKRGSSDELA